MTKLLEQISEWSKKCDHKNKDIKVLKFFEGGYTIQCSGCGQVVTHKEGDGEREKEEDKKVGLMEEAGSLSDVDKI